MTYRLEIGLLGPPQVHRDGQPVTGFRSGKAQALLYYLAATRRTHARTVLAGLFWGDVAEQHARRSLTATLSNLRQLVGDHLEIARETVAFHFDTTTRLDVAEFEAGIAVQSVSVVEPLRQTVDLYRGEFLEGFYIHDAPEFEQWVLLERARLRAALLQGLERLAEWQATQSALEDAIGSMRRVLTLEPWREEAHRQLMLLLAQTGQRSAALAQFEVCRRTLAKELEVEPDQETLALVEQIRAGEIEKITPVQAKSGTTVQRVIPPPPDGPNRPHNLPPQLTSFVGREQELAAILHRLGDPACRLLTLVGAGGSGKTRLALEMAQRLLAAPPEAGDYADGVYFVALQPVNSPDGVVSATAEALNFRFFTETHPRQQLFDFLRNQRMLLLLDNFEHLLAAAEFVSALLNAAPGVKVFVTTRERLYLQEEWLFPLAGLALTQENDQSVPAGFASDAVRLFAQHAHRIQPGFSSAAELDHVLRICRLVDGMPLGIELAAAWLTGLSCRQIANELERGLDILTARYQNTPGRHRSMSTVLEQSWERLSREQQGVLARLSVLHGGFDLEAARAIASASPLTLTILVEKSMVHQTTTDRYQLHELLRQFAAGHLQNPAQACTDHALFFADFAHRCYELFLNKRYHEAVQGFSQEIDNLRTAWQWLVQRLESDPNIVVAAQGLAKLVTPLTWFYHERTLHWEGKERFQAACHAVAAALNREAYPGAPDNQLQILLARLRLGFAQFLYFLGEYPQVEQTVAAALSALRGADLAGEQAAGLELIARSHFRRGNYSETRALLQQSLALMRQADDSLEVARVLSTLAVTAANEGDYDTAVELHSRTAAIYRTHNYTIGMARALINLGCTYRWQGNLAAARPLLEEGHTIALESGNPFLIMFSTSNLASTLSELGDLERAKEHYQESLALAQEQNDQRWIAANLNGMSLNHLHLNELDDAEHCARAALATSHTLRTDPDTLSSLSYLGQIWARRGWVDAAVAVLLYVERHPAATASDKSLSTSLLEELRAELPAELIGVIDEWCASKTLGELVHWIDTVQRGRAQFFGVIP